jgi:hypothetical protein
MPLALKARLMNYQSPDEQELVPTVQPSALCEAPPFFLFLKHYGSSC